MKFVLKYLLIAVFTSSFWAVFFGAMLKGNRCISTTECAVCVLAGVLGLVMSGIGISKIEEKEGK